ncbi:acetate/propionate family kinase [Pseudohongiella nitratireducens]|uniref:acetate/propionate family kinase n=1 Tax=Pseudohongiella nitratireducens TaxID=1768907 RepID=UPI0030EBB857|tara:strand:- start:5874 stop:7712 length:1839 start_codon:yes stop_codon:yes gene_type:complete
MKILVFNAGSSSVKFGIFDTRIDDPRVVKAEFEHFLDGYCDLHFQLGGEQGETLHHRVKVTDVEHAIENIPNLLEQWGYDDFDAIGHRVVHGGTLLTAAVRIDNKTLSLIEDATPLAPLHNPANLSGIYLCQEIWPDKPQVAVFDTSFHQTIPEEAYSYAIPKSWRQLGVRRYGFHGTSHHYVALRVADALQTPLSDLRIISCHLGNGASVCAINHGVSVDTSMGMTPLEGLVMGTRSGDVDPGLFSFLSRHSGMSIEEIERQLYHNSGLKALGGSSDLRNIEQQAAEGSNDAQLAINVYAYRVRKYLGAYSAVMGGVDVVVFTGGIGENSATMRQRICDQLHFLGLSLDVNKNSSLQLSAFDSQLINHEISRIKVIVTRTSEQWMIAKEVQQHLESARLQENKDNCVIPVAVSARHVHLSRHAVELLFGKGYQLNVLRTLRQPGSWAALETVELIGPRGIISNVRILGPEREQTQIEVSRTDTFTLGIEAPVRASGKLDNTPPIRLRGPCGELVTRGMIVAARHIHMHSDDALAWGLNDGDLVDVELGEGERRTLFANTKVRVNGNFLTEMHIDTDEANAAGITFSTKGHLVNKQSDSIVTIVNKKQQTLK